MACESRRLFRLLFHPTSCLAGYKFYGPLRSKHDFISNSMHIKVGVQVNLNGILRGLKKG